MGISLKFRNILEKFDCKNFAIAVSGGSDSMFLAYICKQLEADLKLKFIALIVDHKLRDNSTAEALKTHAFLAKQDISAEIITWEGEKPLSNIHQTARKKRYELLIDFCKSQSISTLMTAHHFEDQAETILLRIIRGTGIEGLRGIDQVRTESGIRILRPLLCFSKNEMMEALKTSNWEWIEDPSNHHPRFERTKVRNLLKQFENPALIIKRLNLLAENARRNHEFIEHFVREKFRELCIFNNLGYITIKREPYSVLLPEVRLRLLTKVLKLISGNKIVSRLNSLKTADNFLLQAYKDKPSITFSDCEIIRGNGDITVTKEMRAVQKSLKLPKDKWIAWDNRYIVMAKIDGLRIGSLGKSGLKVLKSIGKYTLPTAKIMHQSPAIFTENGTFCYHPILKLGQDLSNIICCQII